MAVPPQPTSSTCRAELIRLAGPAAVSQASTRVSAYQVGVTCTVAFDQDF